GGDGPARAWLRLLPPPGPGHDRGVHALARADLPAASPDRRLREHRLPGGSPPRRDIRGGEVAGSCRPAGAPYPPTPRFPTARPEILPSWQAPTSSARYPVSFGQLALRGRLTAADSKCGLHAHILLQIKQVITVP